MLSAAGCQVKVAVMPDRLDPDDYVKKFGPQKFRQEVIEASYTLMAFKLLYYRRGKKLQDEGDRLLYIEEVLTEISGLNNAVEKDYYLRQLAEEFSLSLDALKEQEKQINFAKRRKNKGQGDKPANKQLVITKQTKQLKPAYYTAERNLIAHMLRNIELAFKVQDFLHENTFNVDEHQAIITYLLGFYENGNMPNTSAFIDTLNDEKLKRIVADIEMMNINDELTEQELKDYMKQVFNYQKMLKIKEKLLEQKEAERQSDFSKAALIAMEIIQLRKSL
jgi:DNA primase